MQAAAVPRNNREELKMKIILTIFALILISFGSRVHAEQYLCVSEIAVGFDYNEKTKKWQEYNFNADRKYIISNSKKTGYSYQVVVVGNKDTFAECKDPFNEYAVLFCSMHSGVYEMRFNKKNGKYLLIHKAGYTSDDDKLTPYMEIGKCSPF